MPFVHRQICLNCDDLPVATPETTSVCLVKFFNAYSRNAEVPVIARDTQKAVFKYPDCTPARAAIKKYYVMLEMLSLRRTQNDWLQLALGRVVASVYAHVKALKMTSDGILGLFWVMRKAYYLACCTRPCLLCWRSLVGLMKLVEYSQYNYEQWQWQCGHRTFSSHLVLGSRARAT
eukprot:6180858-Pleurochrysis_carterae.AAC.1